jgi:FixJ family two-component response regulator
VELRSRAEPERDPSASVVVIDDDRDVRESLGRLFRAVGLRSRLFVSIADFLTYEPSDGPTCLVLDVRLPGRSGLDFQCDLAAASSQVPIVFITGHPDVPTSVQAMKAGAIEFLLKPFREEDLLKAVHAGLARDRLRRAHDAALSGIRTRFESLTPREHAVLLQVVKGRLNKQIAGSLGIAEPTVKVHRSNMMRKLNVASVAELLRIMRELQQPPQHSEPADR